MAVLSIHLAYRRWSDLGVVILEQGSGAQAASESALPIRCELVPFTLQEIPEAPGGADQAAAPGPNLEMDRERVTPEILAGRLNHLANVRGIRILILDGPQAWKSNSNGLDYARVSERELNTAAKTGLPGVVRPWTYRPFAEFCIDVWDALCRRGWRRLSTREHASSPQSRVLVESCPFAAWKSLGLKPLRGRRRARVSSLAEASAQLQSVVPFAASAPPNFAQLQALVGGLPGLGLEEPASSAPRGDAGNPIRIVGKPPHREDGQWREGFIVLPVAPRAAALRWLN